MGRTGSPSRTRRTVPERWQVPSRGSDPFAGDAVPEALVLGPRCSHSPDRPVLPEGEHPGAPPSLPVSCGHFWSGAALGTGLGDTPLRKVVRPRERARRGEAQGCPGQARLHSRSLLASFPHPAPPLVPPSGPGELQPHSPRAQAPGEPRPQTVQDCSSPAPLP